MNTGKRCPNCGSTAIEAVYGDDDVQASLTLICEDCDFQFSEGEGSQNAIEDDPDDPDFEGYPGHRHW